MTARIGLERAGRIALLLAAVVSTGAVHASMDTTAAIGSGKLSIPSPQQARLSAMGFDSVVADYYWVQALQLVGGALGAVEQHADTIGELVELVTELDPWVDHPYRFGAIWLTSSVEQVQRANKLLEKGISYHPLEWRNRFYLGYNHFFYLEDDARAAEVLEPAIGMDGAPNYLGAFVTRLQAQGSGLETAALFLEELIRSAPDGYVEAEYLKAYDEIETERRARYLDSARAAFWKRHGRDIESPAELWEGPARVIRQMPPPHPHFPGFEWVLDEESNEIVSSFYGSRYELHIHPLDALRRSQWRPELQASGATVGGAAGEEEGSGG